MSEITPGIFWIKLPIDAVQGPGHINVYFIEGTQGWLLVDTGWNTDESFSTLHNYLIKIGAGFEDIRQIVVTHIHPDHYGMAGRLKKLSGATLAMHHIEKGLIKPRYVSMNELLIQTDRLLIASGTPRHIAATLRDATLDLEHYIVPVPPDITLHDGDTIATGKFNFRVIWTPGHASGHICLYEPDRKILLSGDHILPKITSNISLNPQSLENPLGRYLKSLQEIRELDVKLTLPGHDRPFTRLTSRIDEIIQHHHRRNEEILEVIGSGTMTPYRIAQKITWADRNGWRDLPLFHQHMAIFETLAHLEMMAAESLIDKLPRRGIIYYGQK
jgi:glyoxylase-like metal-dependent hydrolase (beta-lactamase superfamily II)